MQQTVVSAGDIYYFRTFCLAKTSNVLLGVDAVTFV